MNPDAPCLFLGRWQPWHDGHKALVETKLKAGKSVAIGIRDTPKSDRNPYSYMDRYCMIGESLAEWGDKVQIFKVPDFSSIVVGRDVGYTFEQIRLDADIEAISGTKIREATK
jgi:adenylylsulfate kinase